MSFRFWPARRASVGGIGTTLCVGSIPGRGIVTVGGIHVGGISTVTCADICAVHVVLRQAVTPVIVGGFKMLEVVLCLQVVQICLLVWFFVLAPEDEDE